MAESRESANARYRKGAMPEFLRVKTLVEIMGIISGFEPQGPTGSAAPRLSSENPLPSARSGKQTGS